MTIQRCVQFAVCLLLILLLFAFALAGCSPRDQAILQTEVAKGAQTGVVIAQTEGAKAAQTGIIFAQTEAVKVIQTGGASAQTQVAQAAQTKLAQAAKQAATQAAQLRQTASAQLTQSAAKPGGPVIDYFALGDSIASGHGLMDDGTPCHRSSTRSYPAKIAQALRSYYQTVNFTLYACSGATAGQPKPEDLNQDKFKWFRNQVDDLLPKISNRPTLVTINIGMNDTGWADGSMKSHILQWGGDYYGWVTSTTDSISQELRTQIPRLLKYPNVYVVITQVYNPTTPQSRIVGNIFVEGLCNDILKTLPCYERAEMLINGLNNIYMLDVFIPLGKPDHLRVANNAIKFIGHEAPQPGCSNGPPGIADTWLQYPGDPASNGEFPSYLQKLIQTQYKYGDCFHMNEKGAQVFADAVMEQVLRMVK